MPRRPRIHLDGVPLHIVQRQHNREPCFFAEEDYFTYRHWLAEALGEAQCALHAYVLVVDSHSKCTTFSGAEDFMRRQEVEALAGSMIELIDD